MGLIGKVVLVVCGVDVSFVRCVSCASLENFAVQEFVNKSAASAASPDYVKFQAVIKSAALAPNSITA